MTPEEVIVAKKVQGILVRHYVETSKIDVDINKSCCEISGELHLGGGEASRAKDPLELRSLIKKVALTVEQEIRRMSEIHEVHWRLRNWDRVGKQWVQKKT